MAACGIPAQPLLDLIQANRQDQIVTRYETFEDLVGYCRLSANPVGLVVLHIFDAASAGRERLSDSICTALQLVEHWQDVAEDLRKDRIYLPRQDVERFGVTEQDLAGSVTGTRVRALIAYEAARASALLDEGAPLIGMLRGAARLAVAGYVAGGRAALSAIAASGNDVLRVTPAAGQAGNGRESNPRVSAREVRTTDTAEAYRACEEITWSQARNFAYGIRLLPAGKRHALAALYTFARRIDDIGDGTMPPAAKLAALEQARAEVLGLASAGPGALASDPVLAALADAGQRYPIPMQAFGELIDGCIADVNGATYTTFGDLLVYCRCVAGSIGRLSLGVFGAPDMRAAEPLADSLGVALQLTNILRDIREDYRNGRVCLRRT